MSSPVNQASELTKRTFESQVQWDHMFNPPAVEAQAETARAPKDASAIRGLVFGLPAALVLWTVPTAAWLRTGSVWAGVLACVLEFALAAWLMWARRGSQKGKPCQP